MQLEVYKIAVQWDIMFFNKREQWICKNRLRLRSSDIICLHFTFRLNVAKVMK